ncbi:MAG: SpoIIE family protein phosphatase [Gammaproteobacteria bacterium]|nr:SpoIIE family protein phosphatase [Gammaproteobacteria bacterium]
MKILIAEDNFTDRLILKKLVEAQGHKVIEAENGRVALERIQESVPDIILLDAIMPEVDGFAVAKAVKSEYPERYIPIIFITSLTESESYVKCIDAGGDDFFPKPFNKVVLQAKISAFGRAKNLYQTVMDQKKEIEFHSEHLIQEQQVAKKIFDNIAHKGALAEPYIQYSVSPMSIFNGDILLAAKRPLGGINVFLGDFTGHGLPASIGAMPASDIFFGMTSKGFELYEIVQELNLRLHNILPTGFFCCAVVAEIDFEENSLKLWNGGLPDAYVLNRNTGQVQELPSNHLPLGILSQEQFKANLDVRSFEDGESLFVYSDGVTEAENSAGELLGRDRLLVALCEGVSEGRGFDCVTNTIKDFVGEYEQGDDITYIEVKNHKELNYQVETEVSQTYAISGPSDSSIELNLGPKSLKSFNPLPTLSQHLMEIGSLRSFRTQILTILTELYSNSLEHGVLGLSSELKKSADGFGEYYRQREQRLKELSSGYVQIKIKHEEIERGGLLTINFNDSGRGFDYQNLQKSFKQKYLSGRGYPLINQLADSLTFSDGGRSVTVCFKWNVEDV